MIARLLTLILCLSISGCFAIDKNVVEGWFSGVKIVTPFVENSNFRPMNQFALDESDAIQKYFEWPNGVYINFYNKTMYSVRRHGEKPIRENESLPAKFVTLVVYQLAEGERLLRLSENESEDGKNISKFRQMWIFMTEQKSGTFLHHDGANSLVREFTQLKLSEKIGPWILNPFRIIGGYEEPQERIWHRTLVIPIRTLRQVKEISRAYKERDFTGSKALDVGIFVSTRD